MGGEEEARWKRVSGAEEASKTRDTSENQRTRVGKTTRGREKVTPDPRCGCEVTGFGGASLGLKTV
jgi:hypothetical protein